ncbi:hypothetical protein J3R82DRAFT_6814 [Butyriboletus roseoflavus]|nr:hypothetical protein J3R82DRAFT_6814 [Butyriboletus roseoflavus]
MTPGIDPEEEDDDDEPEAGRDELSPPPSPHKPRLKIKLKLPQILSPNEPSSRAASTPSGEPSQPPSHRGISRAWSIHPTFPFVGSLVRPRIPTKNSLPPQQNHPARRNNSPNPEIALRREETARKRKNLTEKKLEDEKAETINRLLKKQSKSKNKRNMLSTADDRTPVSATPAVVQSTRDGSEAPEGEVLEPVELIPTMYRWISTTKPLPGDAEPASQQADGRMKLTFSVPLSILPQDTTPPSEVRMLPTEKPLCDVSGCTQARKYRLVKDWLKGACGMEHLKMLERQMDVV